MTEYTSNLIYLNESGALNEAFSDIMGTSRRVLLPAAGQRRPARRLPDRRRRRSARAASARWPNPQAVRRSRSLLAALHRHRRQRRRPHQLRHPESGLLPGDRGRHQPDVRAVGAGRRRARNREQIEKVFYRAFTQMLPANATFSVARAATIQSARDIFGANSAAERAVTQAWTAVGVN